MEGLDMKVSELIIGGLFYEKKGAQKRIVRITAIESVTRIVRGIYVDDGEDTGWFIVDILQPIPISENILTANGFKLLKEINNCTREYYLPEAYKWGVQWCNIKVVDIFKTGLCIDIELSDYSIFRDHISHKASITECSVHQLQNILYIYGLAKLADNFTIKEDEE